MMEFIKGIFGFVTLTSWAYSTTGLVGCQAANVPYPDWFYPVSAVAVVTFFILLGCLIHEILTSHTPRYRRSRARVRDARCRGMIRFVDGAWCAVRDEEENDEN